MAKFRARVTQLKDFWWLPEVVWNCLKHKFSPFQLQALTPDKTFSFSKKFLWFSNWLIHWKFLQTSQWKRAFTWIIVPIFDKDIFSREPVKHPKKEMHNFWVDEFPVSLSLSLSIHSVSKIRGALDITSILGTLIKCINTSRILFRCQ